MKPGPLFREEVLAEKAHAAVGSIVLVRPVSFAALTALAAALALVVAAFLFVAQYAKKATLAGMLVPSAGAMRPVAPQAGVIERRFVQEGDRVEAGQALLSVVDARATSAGMPLAQAAAALLDRRAAELRAQRVQLQVAGDSEQGSIRARLSGLEAELSALAREEAVLEDRVDLARLGLARVESLEAKGFVSPAQRQQRQEELLDQRSRRQGAERVRLSLAREAAGLRQSLEEAGARLRAQLSALDLQLATLAQERLERRAQSNAIVTAPAAGIVSTLLVEPGQPVGAGSPLLTVLPAGSRLEAHLFAPTRSAGFVREGQSVLVRFPAFPYQKFGSHPARVIAVSRSAAPAADLGFLPTDGSREPLFRVKVALEAQTVNAYGHAEPLQAGMQVEADVLLDRRRVIEWVFEPLFSLAGRA